MDGTSGKDDRPAKGPLRQAGREVTMAETGVVTAQT